MKKKITIDELKERYCRGCQSYEHNVCLAKERHFKICPCRKCIVKGMCDIRCEEFDKWMPHLKVS